MMQPNKKLLAKKRKAQQEMQKQQNEKRQIAEASNVAPEGISAYQAQQRKPLVSKSKTSSSSAHQNVSNKSKKANELSAADLLEKQQHDDDDGELNNDNNAEQLVVETKSNTGLSTATTSVVNRLATLLDTPADGSAFFALSNKIGNEERVLSGAKKMSAKRRTRLEIAGRDGDDEDLDDVEGDDDDDDEANEMRSTQKTFNKHNKVLEVVDDVGPLAPAKRDELKKKKLMANAAATGKMGKTTNEDGADKTDDNKDEEGMKLLKTALRDQNHKKILPHQDRPDYEFRLRRIATSGCVRLFNALAQAQTAGAEAAHEAEKNMPTQEKAESHKILASREAFMSALRGAASSARK